MSGGRLVVLDRAGRDVKHFPLAEGLATLGSDPACDIRIMLPTVSLHHATVVVHANQTVVRNVCEGETLVNGRCVSVAALRHGDVIGIGGRQLRWHYDAPGRPRPHAAQPGECGRLACACARAPADGACAAALHAPRRTARSARRASSPAAHARDPALQLAIEMTHRASMPGGAGGKQVAVVQPQRRDTSEQIDKIPPRTPLQSNKRSRTSKTELDTSVNETENEKSVRKSNVRVSPKNTLSNLQNTTKATLWIESRKTSPRKSKTQTATPEQVLRARRTTASAKKSTPLRLTVLKKAQSAQKMKVTKIEAPLKMDQTKQAAILLMTGHTAKAKLSSPRAPSFVLNKRSSARRSTPRSRSARSSRSPRSSRSARSSRATPTNTSDRTATILEITDSDGRNSSVRTSLASRRSRVKSPKKSPALLSPKKSSLKDPSAKRGTRKTDSIKFDLSNLENHSQDPDVLMVTDTTKPSYEASQDDVTLHYSQSPSPRRSIHSRMRKPLCDSTRTRTRTSRNHLESYSIVDLVSMDTDESAPSTSVYDSAGSIDSTAFGTPHNTTGRKTRSTIDPTLLGSSTPYVKIKRLSTPRSRSDPNTSSRTSLNGSQSSTRSSKSRRSKSLSTPENTENAKKHISVNSTRISRASRSRSRINDSDLLLLDDDDDSPKTSKRVGTTSKSTRFSVQAGGNDTNVTPINTPSHNEGTSTPENRHSPEEASTPVLSIQSLLDSSQSSLASQKSNRGARHLLNAKRKTIGGFTGPKTRVGTKSKSMNFSARQTRLKLSRDSVEVLNNTDGSQDSEIVTPKSAVKLVQEGVKNKHSTAKKPQSKRSIIDDLNESDIVKQLFNSPVKRKLSQSMTEFSRKQLFDDDDDLEQVRRPTRNTIAMTGRSPDNSLLDHTESYTPEIFVSPLSTPRHSPNLDGIKLLFAKTTPENDLRNVKGVKGLLRTPRTRRSIKNDLTNVSGVKNVFAKGPKNSLSDVRVKEVFASSPKNDLSRVTGVKSLFQSTKKRKSPRNELDDVRGVKKLFKTRSPTNDLRNVFGVKRTLRRQSPKNDLSDVRGVRRMFRPEKQRIDLSDVSGVEELFNLSNQSYRDAESLFDQLVGKPQVRAVYSKTFSSKTVGKTKSRKRKSLHASLDVITNNVEGWLEQELNKRLHKENEEASPSQLLNKSKANRTRELQKLVTETVDGSAPIRTSRVRNSTIVQTNDSDIDRKKSASELYSAHTLPIKKRSLVESSLDKGPECGHKLPIKKRAVLHSTPVKGRAALHSTPVKGRADVSLNVSLARVSPIAALDHDASLRFIKPKVIIAAIPKSRRGTRATTDTLNAPEFVKRSPKKTRSKIKIASPKAKPVSPIKEKTPAPKAPKNSPARTKATSPAKKGSPAKTKKPSPAKASPAQAKATRSRRKDVSISESKKRGATLVVAKKSPTMSPQPRANRKRKEPDTLPTPKPSPKKTRATRNNDVSKDNKPKTPKNTRAKVQKATVVVSKPSPQLKPRATKTRARHHSETETTRKTRKIVIVEDKANKVESPKKSQVVRKTRAAEVQSEPKTRGRKTVNVSKETAQLEKPEAKTKKGRKTAQPANKTKNNILEKSVEEPKTVRSRGKKVDSQESVESEPTTRSRWAAKPDLITEVKTRKRKTTAPDSDIPLKVSKSNSRDATGKKQPAAAKTETANTKKKVVKVGQVEKAQVDVPVKTTRGKKVIEVESVKAPKEPVQKTLRGKKANIENVPVNRETGKRKRATATEPSPAEQRSKKQRGGNKAAVAAASPISRDMRTRSTRGNTDTIPGVSKPAGRSRRR